jgi:hypothetical protein
LLVEKFRIKEELIFVNFYTVEDIEVIALKPKEGGTSLLCSTNNAAWLFADPALQLKEWASNRFRPLALPAHLVFAARIVAV